MDIGSLASAFVSANAAQIQMAVAAKLARMNIDAERSVLTLLGAAQQNASHLADGVGGNLDLTV
jgi:hypothetical protein